ncbi:NAD(P)/FAD-dependent oxidoreductase [Nocardia sp. alder85J]|uniref:NAD(P)/FAD-dependent oxidoreductase n=1 Tax=Nocardia sp. alder85J TaxID=2862949 RepID=UPI001CD1D63B|nr:NAD(P)/FAD-dependent oxidoreductase [Nocardia sp. alder85J]MCX4091550.1 NAD(P)/FAD-dependent oxidoreductase [Nocardia sp. alder85J]
MYDAIVVGARCAGSPVGMLLSRRGHRVLVVDRATFPSDTVSTHYIQQRGLARLAAWGLLDELVATGVPAIKRMTVSYKDIVIAGFADAIGGVDATYAPRRTVLDPLLLEGARAAGAEVREGYTVHELIIEDGTVVGIRGSQAGGEVREERARIVIGADGTNSVVANAVGAEIYTRVPAECFVYYTYYSGLGIEDFHSRIGDRQQIGIWPTHDDLTLVAVMRKLDAYQDFRADVEGNFVSIARDIVPEFAEELTTKGTREHRFQPMRYLDNYYRQSHGDGWALVGDAGYHKDPLTGLGISDAFEYAELLADRVHEGLAGDRPPAEALADYQRVRDEKSHSSFEFTTSISTLELTPQLLAVFQALGSNADHAKDFFAMIGGGMTGEEFFAPERIAKLLGAGASA